MKCRLTALILCGLIVSQLQTIRAEEAFRFPEKRVKGELKYINQVPVLLVEGTPEEIGTLVAQLGAKPATQILQYPRDLLKRFGLANAWPALFKAGLKLLDNFPADHRKELEAMAKAGIDREELVVGNTMFDIKKSLACSAVLVSSNRSGTGQPLFGRNLDYPSLGYAHKYSLVTIYRIPGKHAFASVGFPGLVGCLSGMNDAGLCLGVLEIFSAKSGLKKYDPAGTPYALCYRRVLEECTTVTEAEKLLRSMKRTTTTCLAICDKQGGAVFEITPEKIVVRQPTEGCCCCTNHFCTAELKPAKQYDYGRTLERFSALEKSTTPKKLTVDDLHKALHAASHPDHTMQTMVFEPSRLRLHLAIGTRPASAGDFKVLDLAPLLGKAKGK